MKNPHVKATTIKVFMVIAIALIILLSVVGFYFAQNWLKEDYLKNENTSVANVNINKTTLTTGKIQDDIAKYQPIADQASNIFIPAQDYQNQTIKDIKTYTSLNGITIESYEFSQSSQQGVKTTSATSISGKKSIVVNIGGSIQFSKLIKFMKAIETNSPKMQITEIAISPVAGSKDSVKVGPITIEMYSR